MTPTPAKIHTLSLHDALPISARIRAAPLMFIRQPTPGPNPPSARFQFRESTHARPARLIRTDDEQWRRSEEHTSELQSRGHLVCRLLLEKKKHASRKPTHATPC